MTKEFPNKVRPKTADAFEKELIKRGWSRVRAPYDILAPDDNRQWNKELGNYPWLPKDAKSTYSDIASKLSPGGMTRNMFVKMFTKYTHSNFVVCGLEYPDGVEYVLTTGRADSMLGVHPVEITSDEDGLHPDGQIENELMESMKAAGGLVVANA
jgi:hypothetical protein